MDRTCGAAPARRWKEDNLQMDRAGGTAATKCEGGRNGRSGQTEMAGHKGAADSVKRRMAFGEGPCRWPGCNADNGGGPQRPKMRLQVEVKQQNFEEHCRWCSDDSCRWSSRVHLVELQVVWERDFSGAADGAEMISAILICAAACGSGSSSTGHCGGAVRQLQVAQKVNTVRLQVVQISVELRGGESSDLATKMICAAAW